MSKLYARALALVIAGLASATLIGCSTTGSRAGESQLTPAPVVTVTETATHTTTATTTEEPTMATTTRTDESAEADLPAEVQVYVAVAQGMVDAGTVPRSAVTPAAVKEDVAREYGIQLTEAQAERAVAEILGYAR